jgi:hypothetical protein
MEISYSVWAMLSVSLIVLSLFFYIAATVSFRLKIKKIDVAISLIHLVAVVLILLIDDNNILHWILCFTLVFLLSFATFFLIFLIKSFDNIARHVFWNDNQENEIRRRK